MEDTEQELVYFDIEIKEKEETEYDIQIATKLQETKQNKKEVTLFNVDDALSCLKLEYLTESTLTEQSLAYCNKIHGTLGQDGKKVSFKAEIKALEKRLDSLKNTYEKRIEELNYHKQFKLGDDVLTNNKPSVQGVIKEMAISPGWLCYCWVNWGDDILLPEITNRLVKVER